MNISLSIDLVVSEERLFIFSLDDLRKLEMAPTQAGVSYRRRLPGKLNVGM